jgi:hypothetical protein
MQLRMEKDGFIERPTFSAESTFHINGKANRYNVCMWGTAQPHAQIEHPRDSPKVNVFCEVSREKVHSPLHFTETTVIGDSFLDMLGKLVVTPTEYQL